MRKLKFDDVLDAHKDIPCVVACHGPSLDSHKEEIEKLQKQKRIIRLSTNNWYDFFSQPPNYWITSNTEFTIENKIEKLNQYKVPVFYASSSDLTNQKFIDKNLLCDYLPYDQRHFKGLSCVEIVKLFKEHCETNKNLNFKGIGNNSSMWAHPRYLDGAGFSGILRHGWTAYGKCCQKIVHGTPTLQEFLQKISGTEQHCSTADTVAIELLSFAIIMGCNPIYIAGMDLDYTKGYSGGKRAPLNNDWQRLQKNLINDLEIIKNSAKKRGIKIINLNNDNWYKTFESGELP
jgi:hypothetical protein